jgi:hypothetical protein
MTRCDGTKLLTRSPNQFAISVGAFALMLLAASVSGPGGMAVMAEIAYATEIASSEVVGKLRMIAAEFALSEPVYRGTDRGEAILILASVVSGIVAFNLWLLWHLHRVYTRSLQGSGGASNWR